MGLQYGIQQARQTLMKLISDKKWEFKAGEMYSEIGVMQVDDTTVEMFNEINAWQREFLSVTDSKSPLAPGQKEDACKKLAESLVDICANVIEVNSEQIANQDEIDE